VKQCYALKIGGGGGTRAPDPRRPPALHGLQGRLLGYTTEIALIVHCVSEKFTLFISVITQLNGDGF